MNRRKGLALAALVFGMLVLVVVGCVKDLRPQVSVQGITNLDSLTLGDNLVVGKKTTLGSGGLALTGNFSMSNGAILNTKGAVSVTDQLYVTSQISVENGIQVRGGISMTNGALLNAVGAITVEDSLDLANELFSTSGSVRINDPLIITGSVLVAGNIADSGTQSLRLNDDTLVTGTLGVSSLAAMANGLSVANGLTLTGNLYDAWALRLNADTLITGGLSVRDPVSGFGATFRINDATIITGDLTIVGGNIADDGGSVRINDPTLVTGTLGVTGTIAGGYQLTVADSMTVTKNGTVSQQMNVGNGLVAAGGITNTGNLSVTAWSFLSGFVGEVSSTQLLTASYGITPTDQMIIYVSDDGAQATGTVTLDGTTAIVNGTYVGQIILVMCKETHGATLTIPDNANTQGPGNAAIVLGFNDSALFLWDGTDWVCFNVTDV